NAVLLICGPNRIDERLGDYAAFLRRAAEEQGVANRVLLVGAVPFQQMADYYAAADVVVISSLIEGGNKTLSEGTLFGTPFVATESAGTIGFFDSSHGISVPVRDTTALAEALIAMLSDHEAWRRRSTACLAGRERFHSANVAAAMTQVYQRALEK